MQPTHRNGSVQAYCPADLSESSDPWRSAAATQLGLWSMLQRVLALILLLLLCPVIAVIAVLVKITSPGPFLFRQNRPGQWGEPFEILKIRTMTHGAERDRHLGLGVPLDHPQVTWIGRVLRHLKLDELPQLWNVVRSEMDLVGPRPIALALQQKLTEQIPGFEQRLSVRPGLTNVAQVSISDNLVGDQLLDDWVVRFQAERHYVRHKSFSYDAVVLTMTGLFMLSKFLRCEGRGWRRLHTRLSSRRMGLAALLLLGGAPLLFSTGGCAEAKLKKEGFTGDDFVARRPIEDARVIGSLAAQHPATIEVEEVAVESETAGPPPAAYHVGPGDVLQVQVFREPDLGQLTARVDGNGVVQLPLIEQAQVSGMTAVEIQQHLKQRYSEFLKDPILTVQVAQFASQPLYFIGEFGAGGVQFMRQPTNLLMAMSQASISQNTADLRGVRVIRDERIIPVDIYALLKEGQMDQNIWLRPGDTLYAPDRSEQVVFMMGAVAGRGPVPMRDGGRLTLTEAFAASGGPAQLAKLNRVRIIRSLSQTRGELIVVNYRMIRTGEALPFPLMAGDVVFVPNRAIANWNQAINEILPSLQVVGALLQPFVQLRFLADLIDGDDD